MTDHDRDGAFTELADFTVHEPSVKLLGYNYCHQNLVVVLGRVEPGKDSPVTVGMVDPTNRDLRRDLAHFLGRPVTPVTLSAWEIERALDIGYGFYREREEGQKIRLRGVEALSLDASLPVTRQLDELLGYAVRRGASDIHIEVYESDVDVRLRIEGLLRQVTTPFHRGSLPAVVSRLKVLARLDIAERRRAQDGRILAIYEAGDGERPIDFRLSIIPGPCGEDVVLRILDSSTPLLGLDKLGLGAAELAAFENLIANPEGLILVTGPTGSGKTTTLYSAIDRINSERNKILTAEDPIEYHFPKVNQKQVSRNMSFADFARAFLRQDPDVILIGEIRDEETAEAAMRAAQTGHLVLSTLHTVDSVRTISRLRTLGVETNLIANSLLAVVAQRLARRLCAECRVEVEPAAREVAALGLTPGDRRFYRAAGCDACGGDGVKGRIGLFELFVPDEALADRITDGEPIHRLRQAALAAGMRPLVEDALDKARRGLVSLAEILRVVPYRMTAAERGR